MKNYFDKTSFETFGDCDESTSVEMVEAWISARCSPEILETIFDQSFLEPGQKTIQIYKSLLEDCSDKLPQGIFLLS
jgi:hypothetical protein